MGIENECFTNDSQPLNPLFFFGNGLQVIAYWTKSKEKSAEKYALNKTKSI
jgi:hypothetical protein